MWQEASTLILKNCGFSIRILLWFGQRKQPTTPEEGEDDRHARQGRGLLPNSASKVRGVLGMIWILYLCVLRLPPLCLGRERWGCKVYARQCYLFGEAESSTLSCCTGVKETPVRWGRTLWTVSFPDSGAPPFFFGMQKKASPAALHAWENSFQPFWSNSRRGCTCSQATLLWSLYGRMSTRRGSKKMSTVFSSENRT